MGAAGADDFRQFAVVPALDVVERAVDDQPLRRVTSVVENDHDGIEPYPGAGRQLHPRHLEGAIADEDERPLSGRASWAPIAAGTAKPREA